MHEKNTDSTNLLQRISTVTTKAKTDEAVLETISVVEESDKFEIPITLPNASWAEKNKKVPKWHGAMA